MKKGTIIILLLLCVSMVLAQPAGKIVEGYVYSQSTGEGLIGVNVTVDSKLVITDITGHYRIPVEGKVARISYSYPGFLSRTLTVATTADSTHVQNIYMYKEVFSHAAAQNNVYNNTAALDLSSALHTQLAHDVRTIDRSGQYGIGANMFIRGYNSLNSNAQPLIVIDGVVMEYVTEEQSVHDGYMFNRLLDIDVADIDHVEILKDASSIYGSKGANGAICVFTNRGLPNQTKITVDLSHSVKQRPALPKTMDADEFRMYVSEIYKGSPMGNTAASSFDGLFNNNSNDKTYNINHNHTDWDKEVMQTGNMQRYALGITGGDNVATYHVSAGYLQGDETMKEFQFQRINTRVNADISLSDRFNVGTEVYFSRIERDLRDDGANPITSPAFTARIKAPFYHPYSYTDDGTMVTNTLAPTDELNVSNPTSIIVNGKGKHKQYRFNISASPSFMLGKGWTLRGQFAYYQDNLNEHYFSPMYGVTPVKIDNVGTSYNCVKEQNIRQSGIYANAEAVFRHDFYNTHLLDLTLGDRLFSTNYKDSYGEGHNTGDDQIFNLSTSLDFLKSHGNNQNTRSTSAYLHARYSLMHKYGLWGVMTADASSRFGADAAGSVKALGTRWALFPSLGAEWDAKAEHILSAVSWIDALKLHASWGRTGNDVAGTMASKAYLTPVNYVSVATGTVIGNLRNSALKWEVTTKRSVGLTFSLLKDRISMGIDLFKNTTDDLLTLQPSSIYSGLDAYLTNSGSLENQGFETQVNVKAVNSRHLSWNLSASLAHYKNKITALPHGSFFTNAFGGSVLSEEGHPAGVFYGYKTAGVIATTQEANNLQLKVRNDDTSLSSFAAGDIHFVEPNPLYADGIIDENDRTIIGDPNPDFTGAFTSNLQWQRFTLDVRCAFTLGGDIYNYQRSLLEAGSTLYNQSRNMLNRWKAEGQLTRVPRTAYGDPLGNSRFSDRWIEDGTFFKVKNIRLTYYLPFSNPYIEAITLWCAVDNVFTFTRYLGADPETACSNSVLLQGIDYGLLPSCRTYTLGIKINL